MFEQIGTIPTNAVGRMFPAVAAAPLVWKVTTIVPEFAADTDVHAALIVPGFMQAN